MVVITIGSNGNHDTGTLYQWDTHRTIHISGLDIDFVPELHFANEYTDNAIAKKSTVDDKNVITADIPSSLLKFPHTLFVYVCKCDGDKFGTQCLIKVPVTSRPKPPDYIYEDEEECIYSYKVLKDEIDAANKELKEINCNLGNKVDKEEGKGLSTNDYTNEEKQKLSELYNYDDSEIKKDIKTILDGDIKATAIKSHTILKHHKLEGWIKFATIPYRTGYRSENVLMYMSSSYVDGRFGALVYLGLNPNGADYHNNSGIIFKQVAGDDIAYRLAYYKDPETKELSLYYYKHSYVTLDIGTVFNSITNLTFEPTNDACEVIKSIEYTGKAVYVNAPMATKAECDSDGKNIKSTYATKVQLSEKMTYKGTEEISLLPTNGNNAGDMYKLTETITIPKYRYLSSGKLVYNAWYADFDGDGVDELILDGTGFYEDVGCALLTEEELEEYFSYINIPINIYDENKVLINTTSMFWEGAISLWMVNSLGGIFEGNTYYIERADGVVPDGVEPEVVGETTTVEESGYALYNGKTFDRLYTKENVDKIIHDIKTEKEWKLLGETEITQDMIDAAGSSGINAIVVDLGEPITEWYGETWVRFECDTTSSLNAADGSVCCKLGATVELATSHIYHDCSIVISQSSAYAPIYYKNKNRINIFTNWYNNQPFGSMCQNNGFSASNYPVNTHSTSNNPDDNASALGKRYLGFYDNGKDFKFPVGTKLKVYGRF